MEYKKLIKELKKEHFNDYAIILNSVVFGFKYWICSSKTDAEKLYKLIVNSLNLEQYKPYTLNIKLLI